MENYEQLKADMQRHALKDYPREAVGIITKDFLYIPCLNISESPKTTFYLDPAALVKHDGNIWGIFHSHPGEEVPIPSAEDKVSAAFTEYKFLVGFTSKVFIYWLDENIDALLFEPFEEKHCVNTD